MPRKVNIKEILKKNLHINAEQFKDSLQLTEELRKLGLTRRGYQLTSPLVRGRIHIVDDSDPDPRTVQLHRH